MHELMVPIACIFCFVTISGMQVGKLAYCVHDDLTFLLYQVNRGEGERGYTANSNGNDYSSAKPTTVMYSIPLLSQGQRYHRGLKFSQPGWSEPDKTSPRGSLLPFNRVTDPHDMV